MDLPEHSTHTAQALLSPYGPLVKRIQEVPTESIATTYSPIYNSSKFAPAFFITELLAERPLDHLARLSKSQDDSYPQVPLEIHFRLSISQRSFPRARGFLQNLSRQDPPNHTRPLRPARVQRKSIIPLPNQLASPSPGDVRTPFLVSEPLPKPLDNSLFQVHLLTLHTNLNRNQIFFIQHNVNHSHYKKFRYTA